MNGCVNRLYQNSQRVAQVTRYCASSQVNVARGYHVYTAQNLNAKSQDTPKRYQTLNEGKTGLYPRLDTTQPGISCSDFVQRYYDWTGTEAQVESDICSVNGRVYKVRSAGSRLSFIDIIADNVRVQGVCNLRALDGVSKDQFKEHFHTLQRGDVIKLTGKLCKTTSGEPSIGLDRLPILLSPCLHPLPTHLHDPEVIVTKRHVGFLTNEQAASFIRAKSKIIQAIRQFLMDDNHVEVQTPILADAAGGAVARPFRTKATEFTDRELALRIAPELWLKRMVVGGFDRIFEIGPSFRNEGIDLTHNPEFITCEFYRAYTDLKGLMNMTERIFEKVAGSIRLSTLPGLEHTVDQKFSPPYKNIDFISGIEQALGAELPDLSSPAALSELKSMLDKLSVPLQITDSISLPQLLDKLSGEYLEPLCQNPTFITGHPECMSPLSKSHPHPTRTSQRIAARAELFIRGQEIANMYEEENSPIEQRRKFIEQLAFKGDAGGEIDEAYLEALEWGMPPVGGWGCGIERLTMAMTGAARISDVLSFGTLRNVISKHRRK